MVLLPLWQSAFRLFWISLGKVGFNLHGGEPFFTRSFKFQAKITYRANQLNTLLFDTYGSECEYHWEVEESALVRALAYFDEVLG